MKVWEAISSPVMAAVDETVEGLATAGVMSKQTICALKVRIPVEKSFAAWRKDPKHVEAYTALEDEFSLASATLIDGRAHAAVVSDERRIFDLIFKGEGGVKVEPATSQRSPRLQD
jgi:hypothetical protein